MNIVKKTYLNAWKFWTNSSSSNDKELEENCEMINQQKYRTKI